MHLSELPVSDHFRLRGERPSRLDTFVDAAFAFAVTLLVVSFDAMPDTFAELYDALRRLPAFLAGFAIIALFWSAHHRFSRRAGLEDAHVQVLTLALVAAVLFYVYPLRMVMSAGMHYFTGGWAPSEFRVDSFLEFRIIFVIYGVGFALLSGLVAMLNRHALRNAASLRLDAAERLCLRREIGAHAILVAVALLSVLIALLMPAIRGWMQALPGMCYALLGALMPWHAIVMERRIAAAAAAREADAAV